LQEYVLQQTANTFIQLSKKEIYTYDWFSHNIPSWKIWLKKFKNKEQLSFLEIGCYEGKATRWLLDNILTKKNSCISVVDTFTGSIEHSKIDNSKMLKHFMNNVGYDKRVKVFQSTSKIFLQNSKDVFDFVYIDGSHIAKDVMTDAVLSWDRLKRNGVLVFDDYEWKKFPKTSKFHPKMAIDSFMKMYKDEFKIVGKNYQICLMKTAV